VAVMAMMVHPRFGAGASEHDHRHREAGEDRANWKDHAINSESARLGAGLAPQGPNP
jgi:hypothetical protein